ncbi:MAG: 2-amino-4-hydroxy-6-hydroxymethyldihydropteridine diphosphokinase [Massilibacteroides sp.]|nr:2-amino-4-hydroxy-6-hydroxymethyldihydropteridine diphosphokinase [Massilibacteroides sp.]MDD3062333.1 2-amino-4-hydroxy-6-hydroxymethyldihydropteridine diphosphokinase [Massilibacteroides sp.]MDD4115201.1 2-amino-4-hydroxy-6-hydroxymethyldihydropteridine diphosphokinase [Massilibacteroides sp.]MDD4660685.1 2-amino-4-hydroxy-6-hydroxymethyldihydropteridine diphosphokinase [Massilibacteroides sp.]
MAQVAIGLGTNLGDREKNMLTAVALLAERAGTILALSALYETEPWGFESENPFFNAALILETELSPLDLLLLTQRIEREMGRVEKSSGTYHDRLIDIDLLLYDDIVLESPLLMLPHPLMHQRKFVLQPLEEIAPGWIHPVLKEPVARLYAKLSF